MKLDCLPTIFAVAFIAFTSCSLQFFELSKLSHQTTMAAYEGGGILAPENLERVLPRLELIEQRNARESQGQSLAQSEEWAEAQEKLARYSTLLKLKNDFHRDSSQKLSDITLRNSIIGLVLILFAAVTAPLFKWGRKPS